MNLYPHLTMFEENRRELERERRRRQQIRAARAERRAQRPARFTAFRAWVRRTVQAAPVVPVVEDC